MYISLDCQGDIAIGMFVEITLVSRKMATFCDRGSQNSRKNAGVNMAEKQQNERKATRFDGVYQRPSRSKKYEGKPDVTYSIDYYDPHSGKRVRKTIGSRSEGITAEYANSVRQGLISKAKKEVFEGIVPQQAKQVPTLEQAWLRYRSDWLEATGKSRLYQDTRCYIKHIRPLDLNHRPLNRITVDDLDSFTKAKRAEGYAPQTVHGMLNLIRRIMNKSVKWKMWRGPLPFVDFTMPEFDNERTRYLGEDDLRKVFAKLREKSHRAWLMALLSLQCGLRFGEIAKLELNDINFADGTIFIRRPKNRRSRYVAMTQSIQEALREWLQSTESNPKNLVFPNKAGNVRPNADGAFREVIKELGLNDHAVETKDRLVFHSLRHTFASHLAKKGYSEMMLAKLLGHRSTVMTRRYAHLMPETRRAAAEEVENLFSMVHPASPK
jgi:integrase